VAAIALVAAQGCAPSPAPAPSAAPTASPSASKTAAPAPQRAMPGALSPVLQRRGDTQVRKMLPAYPLVRRPAKADQYDDYRAANPSVYNITASPASPIIAPGEFEQKRALALSWTGSFPDVVAQIVQAASPVTEVWVLHYGTQALSDFQSQMAARGVDTTGLHYLNKPNDSIWVRDFGPISVYDADTSSVGLVDMRYYHQRVYDDAVPYHMAAQFGLNRFAAPISYEGGNFMADGRGTCYASMGVLWYNGVSETTIRQYFRDYLGCYQLIILNPLDGEGTAHLDMFAKLANDHTVILGRYETWQDSTNAAVLEDNADILSAVVLPDGGGLDIVRMPMPSNGDGNYRTYVNSQFINGVNLVPVYADDTQFEAQALSIWQQTMPTWQHVPIDASELITWAGAIHCICMEVQDGTWQPFQSAPEDICTTSACYPSSTGGNAGCGTVQVAGSCAGDTAAWCDFGAVQSDDCAASGQTCGWQPTQGHYGCGTGGACVPDCLGKACGPDGCGGSCGTCGAGLICQGSACVQDTQGCGDVSGVGCCDGTTLSYCNNQLTLTTVDCPDGCGWSPNDGWYDCGFSGSDPSGTNPLQCPGTCAPDCAGKVCGDDGCGGSCGTCPAGSTCDASGSCTSTCVPDCTGKTCGDDGCGGLCGSCAPGMMCTAAGTCELACVPQCDGKVCGDDGCGDVCGICAGQSVCQAGQCVSTCVPSCAGKACGDDGCGGVCGVCGQNEYCDASNQCVPTPTGDCGDIPYEGVCQNGEVVWCDDGTLQTTSCSSGCCGWVIADGYYWCYPTEWCPYCWDECQAGEHGCSVEGTHAWTCGTKDGWPCQVRDYQPCPGGCDDTTGACATTCTPDCTGLECGDDGCGGSCGTCAGGDVCGPDGLCGPPACVPDCTNKVCGDDGCGGNCGDCQPDETCDAGQCVPGACVPACDGKECGPDGCGGSCGACAAGQLCTPQGTCDTAPCVPVCDGKTCGDDGCGGSCGSCPSGQTCNAQGQCEAGACVPACDGKTCGDDGCGGSCGSCPDGQTCNAQGQCEAGACSPACDGKACGDDGCGGSCGSCPSGQTCNAQGQCEAGACVPACDGKACGDDGCGGSCGSCPTGQTCNAQGQCGAVAPGCGDLTADGVCEGTVVRWCENDTVQTFDCADQGKTCGTVPGVGSTCVELCTPSCDGKNCGDDGCGGSCGACPPGQTCGDDGQCTAPAAEPGADAGSTGEPDASVGPSPDVTGGGEVSIGEPDVDGDGSEDGAKSSGCAGAGSAGSLPAGALGLLCVLWALVRRRGQP